MVAIHGFGIDRVARAVEQATPRWPVLRLENLDTDLPLPPEAIPVTAAALGTRQGQLLAAVHRRRRPARRHQRPAGAAVRPPVRPAGRDRRHQWRHRGRARLPARHDRPGRRGDPHRSDLRRAGQPGAARRRGAEFRARTSSSTASGAWTSTALRAKAPTARAMLLMSPSMPSGAVLTDAEWRAVCDLCVEHDLLLIYDAAMERLLFDGREPLHPVALPGHGRAHPDRGVAVQGVPDDRVAGRLGGRAGGARRERRLGARLQHHDAGRHRPGRRHRGPARRPRPRRASARPNCSAAATPCSPRPPGWPRCARPAGGRC